MPGHSPEFTGIEACVQSGKTRSLGWQEPFVALVPIPDRYKAKGLEAPSLAVPRLSREQGAILSAYTGMNCCEFEDLRAYAEKLMGRPVREREVAELAGEIKKRSTSDFFSIVAD